jgi:surface antigen
MKKITTLVISGVLALGLAGCASDNGGITKQQIGTVAGGVAGGILGATVFHGNGQVPGAIGGAIVGAMLGSAVGSSMDKQDQINAQQAMINTPVGQEASWSNQNTGATYTVKPVSNFTSSGRDCRRALTTVILDGKTKKAYTTICRNQDGDWQVQN